MDTQLPQKDHDLLIRLDQKISDLIKRIDDINNTNTSMIGELKAGKVDVSLFSSHCSTAETSFKSIKEEQQTMWKKVDVLYKYLWISMGGATIISIALPYLLKKLFGI
jgi:hypothetical protein